MYKPERIYGQTAYELWTRLLEENRARKSDLRDAREDARVIDPADGASWDSSWWKVTTYSELVDAVSFLSVMNKRLDIAFRGQPKHFDMALPAVFRDSWTPPDWTQLPEVALSDPVYLLSRLAELGDLVYSICYKRGLPRWRTLERVQEARWAVIQHYGLWPTPLIDLTTSLRVAASFALTPPKGDCEQPGRREDETISGYLYVVGLPNRSGSITYSLDDQLLVADLRSVCPPDARRPHLQDGLLVGRFPTDNLRSREHSNLRRRVIAQIRLVDRVGRNGFWSEDFPRLRERSLLPPPDDDPLLENFTAERSRRREVPRRSRLVPPCSTTSTADG